MKIILSLSLSLIGGAIALTPIQGLLAADSQRGNSEVMAESSANSEVPPAAGNESDRLIFSPRAQAKDDAPDRRESPPDFGGGGCPAVSPSLTALVPGDGAASSRVLTAQANPTLWFYVPPLKKLNAEFSLINNQNERIAQQSYQLTGMAGIVKISLPSTSPLEVGKDYHWVFKIICDPQDRSADLYVSGKIQRVQPMPSLVPPANATPDRKAILYARDGLWYDALTVIINEIHPTEPQKARLRMTELFQSEGLEMFARQPVMSCCSATP